MQSPGQSLRPGGKRDKFRLDPRATYQAHTNVPGSDNYDSKAVMGISGTMFVLIHLHDIDLQIDRKVNHRFYLFGDH